MATANVTNMTKQLKFTGKGYLDYKMQPVETVEELNDKFKNNNELKLGLTVTVLNGAGENVPLDYWYYFPFDDETGTFDTSVPPVWCPKVNGGQTGGDIFWQDGGESTSSPDFEAWKDAGIE